MTSLKKSKKKLGLRSICHRVIAWDGKPVIGFTRPYDWMALFLRPIDLENPDRRSEMARYVLDTMRGYDGEQPACDSIADCNGGGTHRLGSHIPK